MLDGKLAIPVMGSSILRPVNLISRLVRGEGFIRPVQALVSLEMFPSCNAIFLQTATKHCLCIKLPNTFANMVSHNLLNVIYMGITTSFGKFLIVRQDLSGLLL